MKKISRIWIIALLLTIAAGHAYAQVTVRIRPARPRSGVVIKVPPRPSPRHVWVQEDWRPRGNRYEFHGGYYAAPPRPRAIWVPGQWAQRRRGWIWVPGYWR